MNWNFVLGREETEDKDRRDQREREKRERKEKHGKRRKIVRWKIVVCVCVCVCVCVGKAQHDCFVAYFEFTFLPGHIVFFVLNKSNVYSLLV